MSANPGCHHAKGPDQADTDRNGQSSLYGLGAVNLRLRPLPAHRKAHGAVKTSPGDQRNQGRDKKDRGRRLQNTSQDLTV